MSDQPDKKKAPPPYTVEHNRDGSTSIKLLEPIAVEGETTQRLLIPALTGRHMRRATWPVGAGATIGDLVTFAAEIVQPAGVIDELPAWIAKDIAGEVLVALGKSKPTGERDSPA